MEYAQYIKPWLLFAILCCTAQGATTCFNNTSAFESGTTTSTAATFVSSLTTGNLAVVAYAAENGTTTTSVSGSVNGAYTKAVARAGSNGTQLEIWYKKSVASGAETVTVSHASGTHMMVALVECSSGGAGTLDIDVTCSSDTTCSLTTTRSADALIGAMSNGGNLTAGTGYTVLDSQVFNNFNRDEWKASTTPGSYNVDWTGATPSVGAAFGVASTANSPMTLLGVGPFAKRHIPTRVNLVQQSASAAAITGTTVTNDKTSFVAVAY